MSKIEIYKPKELTELDIINRMKNIFKFHIGQENCISPHELFKEVYGSVPENCDFYERLYLWTKIKCAMSSGRSLGELFIMYNNKRFFVLSNEKELEMFKKQTYKHINALSNRIIIAENWVQEKRWKKLM